MGAAADECCAFTILEVHSRYDTARGIGKVGVTRHRDRSVRIGFRNGHFHRDAGLKCAIVDGVRAAAQIERIVGEAVIQSGIVHEIFRTLVDHGVAIVHCPRSDSMWHLTNGATVLSSFRS